MTAPITVDQLEEGHALVLGTTGSGKTYTLRGLLEQLRRADRRVGAVDKLGNHWGLTAGADGESVGLEFVIFGGRRAHVPMTSDQGAQLGRLFVERGIPAIFDVSEWKRDDQERWVGDFADAVFETNTTALHLAFDEAQSWVPQGGGGEAFAGVQRLAEQGRGRGIRLLLTCQRLSRLDATVRGMMHTVVSMRQTATLDRKAVADLVASDKADQQLLEQLPKLEIGTGFLWDPARAGLELVCFPANTTFDSSRTPRHGDTPPAPIVVSSALVDELRAALAPAEPVDTIPADAEAAYRAGGEVDTMLRERDDRISALEATVAEQAAELENLRGCNAECDQYQDGLGVLEQLLDAVRAGKPIEVKFSPNGEPHRPANPGGDHVDRSAQRAEPHSAPSASAPGVSAAAGGASETAPKARGSASVAQEAPSTDGASDLAPRHQRILGAIAWAAAYLKQEAVPRAIVGWIAETSATSGSFRNDLGALRSAGLIDYPAAGALALTDAGAAATPALTRPRTRKELWAAIGSRLQPRHRAMIDALWNALPRSREALAGQLGISPTSGSFRNDLGHLRTLGLIDYPAPGQVVLAELLR